MEGARNIYEKALGDVKDFTRDLRYRSKKMESIKIR